MKNITIGIIGGMGTLAGLSTCQISTNSFIEKNICIPKIILYSDETIPDRTSYLMGKSIKNPAKKISEIGNDLLSQGADLIVIACFTAHSKPIWSCIDLKVRNKTISLIEILNTELIKITKTVKIGILATTGSVYLKNFENFESDFIEYVYPNSKDQTLLMNDIYHIKKNGVTKLTKKTICQISSRLSQSCDYVLIGCTELLLIDFPPKIKTINAIKLLGDNLAQIANE